MMIGIPIILLTILILMIILGIIVILYVWKRRSKGITEEPNYLAFFIMGISFLPMGTIFTITISPGFMGITAMGLIYMAIGLANRDKWKNWKE